jgi:beta-carotene hydroxylase
MMPVPQVASRRPSIESPAVEPLPRGKGLDWRTLTLFAVYVVVLPINVALAARGALGLVWAFLIALAAFNLSFTIWHESVHNTVAPNRTVSTIIGTITAFFLIYPGYNALKRDHLVHHKHQGEPDVDPVYPRVQCRPWLFPVHMFWCLAFPQQPPHPERQLTSAERAKDAVNYAIWLALALAAWRYGYLPALMAAWILPRLVILPIHEFYVCYLPHAAGGPEFYRTYRIVLRTPFTRYLTLYHSYHGLHHVWPSIPWHQYRAAFQSRRRALEQLGVEIVE